MDKVTLSAEDLRFNPPSFEKSFLSAEVKKHFGLAGTMKPLVGERDQNHLLKTEDGKKYVVKVAGPDEDRLAVDYQIKTLLHIEKRNPALNIPRNLKTKDGKDFILIQSPDGRDHMMRLLSWVDGVPFGDAYQPPAEVLSSAGRFQAQMCVALADFSHPCEKDYFMPWDTSQGLIANPALRVSKYGDVEQIVLPLLDHIEGYVLPNMNNMRKQTIHNDSHNDNILRSSPDAHDFCGVIDFGDICYAPIIQDLSVPMIGFVGDFDYPLVAGGAYVKGFASACPLKEEELDILYDLLILRAALTVQLIDFRIQHQDADMHGLVEYYPRIVTRLKRLLAIDKNEITDVFHQEHSKGVNA